MAIDAWLPKGQRLPDGAKAQSALFGGPNWQIVQTQGDGSALIATQELFSRWLESGLVENGTFDSFEFSGMALRSMSCGASQALCPVADGRSPDSKSEALSFAVALKATRDIAPDVPLQDALYVEKLSRLLPTYSISSRTDDDVVLGYWLTGGIGIPARSFRRLRHTLSWLGAGHLKEVVEAAGFQVQEVGVANRRPRPAGKVADTPREAETKSKEGKVDKAGHKAFSLAGRSELSAFFNEHVIDIVQNRERYKALGIDFPSAIVLHGPPGCGKTFAVERLVEYLGWPNFEIDASSVASPYIHETSRKVAEVFDKAIQNAPSVLVIDEMEAFLADREMGTGHHRVEEVAEFLRRIPEATKSEVLIVAMTNRVDMIDPAILRRGRFDHVIAVDYAREEEVRGLLEALLASLPTAPDVDPEPFARELQGRPLSDVAFVVREGARLAARAGKDRVDQGSLRAALSAAPVRKQEGPSRRIGFV